MQKNVLVAILLWMVCSKLFAQDTHYWTQQYGTSSALMGGAVIASNRDNTALYYNPGALGWIDTSSISVNANGYQNENVKIENALGKKADFKSNHIGSVPLFIGGMIKTKNSPYRISYGVLAQTSFDFKADARVAGSYQLINDEDSPGNENAIGQTSIDSRVSELSAGVGVGRKIGKWFSIGIAGGFIVRSVDYSHFSLVRVYMNQSVDPLVTSTIIQNVNYYNVRFQPKLGFSYEKGKWQAGITIAPPSLNLFGKGSVGFDATATNIKPANQTSRIDFVANDRQEKLKTKYKSPFSVSAGVGYTGGRSHIELAAQYFASIDMYPVINAKASAFARPADAYPDITSDQYLRVLTSAEPVFNVGIAYEYILKPSLILYISARNDQSYFDKAINEQTGIKPDISSWDIYHFVAGTTISKGRSSISVGLTAAFGSDNHREQTGSIDNDTESNFFRGTTTITKASYSSIGILLGYTYYFRKF